MPPVGAVDLLDDLAGREVPREPHACPVRQNVQPTAQPTWDETQSVLRSGSGMYTDSTSFPSCVRQVHLMVPSVERCSLARSSVVSAVRSRERGAERAGHVGELVERRRALLVEPAVELPGPERPLAQRRDERREVLERHDRRSAGDPDD